MANGTPATPLPKVDEQPKIEEKPEDKRLRSLKELASFMGKFAAVAAGVCFVYALIYHRCWSTDKVGTSEAGAKPGFEFWGNIVNPILLACWTLLPPIWFWVHWYRFPSERIKDSWEWESMTHGHELSRNLWLAFVVVLAVLFRAKWPGS